MVTLIQFVRDIARGNRNGDTHQEPDSEYIDQLINELHDIDENGVEAVRTRSHGYSSAWEDFDTATKIKFSENIQDVLDEYIESIRRLNELSEEEDEIADDFIGELPGGEIPSWGPPQVTTRVEGTPIGTPQPRTGPFRELLWEHKDTILSSDSPEELRARLIQEAERKYFEDKNIFEWYGHSWFNRLPKSVSPPWHEVIYHQKEESNLEQYVKLIKKQKKCKSAVVRHAETALELVEKNYRQ